jgi:hypothetical protein
LKLTLIFTSMILLISNAFAKQEYECEIKTVAIADLTNEKVLSFLKKSYIGKKFKVDVDTAKISGTFNSNPFTKPQIIDKGSKENSFKLIQTMKLKEGLGKGSTIQALTISEYFESNEKPFIFLNTSEVFIGTCIKTWSID